MLYKTGRDCAVGLWKEHSFMDELLGLFFCQKNYLLAVRLPIIALSQWKSLFFLKILINV